MVKMIPEPMPTAFSTPYEYDIKNNGCSRVGSWFRGCFWEGRYDVFEPTVTSNFPVILTAADVKDMLRKTVYVRDVCRTCGAVKER